MATEGIALQVDIKRIIEVLARQIYQSPLALLRENTQNAFDAVVLRKHATSDFQPEIHVEVTPHTVVVRDNGIGMTSDDLSNHFWRAGSSSKNNEDARAAGVVGTFGIGAMANFGIASELTVETESAQTGERTRSSALRENLSTEQKCISLEPLESTGNPGTSIFAAITPGQTINVGEALTYLSDFVAFAPIRITFNGSLISQKELDSAVPQIPVSWKSQLTNHSISPRLIGDIDLTVSPTGEVRIALTNMTFQQRTLTGKMVLRQGASSMRTFRNGFGLATASASSAFAFGGAVDLLQLQPTAGREALETESLQLLQSIISDVDAFVANQLALRPEANLNTAFLSWVVRHGRYDLAGNIKIRCEPGNEDILLSEIASSGSNWQYYAGTDTSIIRTFATDETKLLVIAQNNPRKQCQLEFLRKRTKAKEVSNDPKVLSLKEGRELTAAQGAVLFRITSILDEDYFLKVECRFGKISHGLPVLVDRSRKPLRLVLDPDAATLAVLVRIYGTEYGAFAGMAKDFVRNVVFPRVSEFVPSSTRQGADAFLRSIKRQREVFEIGSSDMTSLGAIWDKYLEGEITIDEAAKRSSVVVRMNIQRIDSSATRSVRSVVPDVVDNEAALVTDEPESIEPLPPILRLDAETDAKLLTLDDHEAPLKGYRCFIALTDRTRDEYGDFFLQPHRTSIVWGGQKVLFIFQHHSGRFGLYYDLQLPSTVSADTGGAAFTTCTLVLKNRTYVPIPSQLRQAFMPTLGETKRIEVRCDLLYSDDISLPDRSDASHAEDE